MNFEYYDSINHGWRTANTLRQLTFFIHRDYIRNLQKGDMPQVYFLKFEPSIQRQAIATYKDSIQAAWVDYCIKHKRYNSDPVILKMAANNIIGIDIARKPDCQYCTRLGQCLFCSGQLERP